MKGSEFDLVIAILTYSAWFLGACLLLIGVFAIVKYKRESRHNEVKEFFFKDRNRPNGKPKITKGKF